MNRPVARRRIYAVAAGSLALGLALSACGGSSKSSTSATTTPSSAGGNKAAGGARRPTAIGPVTAVEASSMKVTSTQYGKVVVDWTTATDFSKTEKVTKADLTSGTCVTVVGSGTGSKVTARTVELSQPVSGKCSAAAGGFGGGGFGGGGGTFPGRGKFTGKRPTGSTPNGSAPNGSAGRGNFRGGGAGGDFYTGKVTSLSGDKLVISGSTGFGSKSTTTKTIDLTLASTTTYSETAKVTSKDVAVGDCVLATGTETSNTTMKASTVRITSTGGKSCTGGFAFGRGKATNG